ncbi:NAD(P)/FAD-dependent oxidoreductase [Vibrio neptunius]|uniref:NAD(P)/FAD-dependent oxidoreductase n=1 Tax=Vibrio neptunius TaxID=170651 RepID=UPI001C5CAF0D|nr:NAD(P)/FAD-dependent oxidoreductase [Vibrio neptunius]QXX07909.1 NAD(P)/FAD-dependent oxidoreductase [Vibrio neptunius]
MKIAIIGTGISGLTCAYHLNKQHDVTLFEANDYIGGHTATVNVEVEGENYAVDTGFIVYNDRTYPNFIAMMDEVGVEGLPTQMSFSVRNDGCGLEYNGHTVSTLFAQKRNWFNPKFYAFIFEILRFNKQVKRIVEQSSECEKTLGDFLSEEKFSDYFCNNYILPMGAAIWSSTLADMRAFPLQFFARFFLNHGLLDVLNRPQWYVIKGGSNAYVEPLTQEYADRIHLSTPVKSVCREQMGVRIDLGDRTERFDQVIFACHSDQALALLSDASDLESKILGQLEYQANEVTLHTDESLLPKRKSAWASWNYWLDGKQGESERPPTLTYNMNILQHIQAPVTFCVSLNSGHLIDSSKVLKTFTYHHPVFSEQSMQAQQRRKEINGQDKVWFCGAYWYNGFHEDGVRSALDIVSELKLLKNVDRQRGAA